MKIKKAIAVTLAAVAACATIGMASCGESKQELIVYTEAGFAPWEFTKKGSTKVIGVDMEIAKYIADKYDWELKVVNGSFDSIVAGIAEDNALGIAGISYSESRAEAVEFSSFYWEDAYQAVVYKTSSNPELIDGTFAASNFEGAKLVYQTGTTSQLTVEDNEAWNYASVASFSQVMAALQDMKTATDKEFLIVDSQVAAQLVAEDNTLAYAQIEGMEAEKYGVVAKKGNSDMIAKVNAALAELLTEDANGKNQIEKWFDEYSVVAEDAE
jgi:polar amino acid transport system substrate-binding protein